MIDPKIFSQIEEKMKKTIDAVQIEFASIRTGRASPGLLDKIQVSCYESVLPLKQVASVSVPEPRMLVVHPWDKSTLGEIEKAILKSDLGITPTNDGNIIRLAIPSLTEERRADLVKIVRRKTEEGKISLRNIRRDGIDTIKEIEKKGEISEDDSKRAQEQVQKIIDKYTNQLDEICKAKEKEISEV